MIVRNVSRGRSFTKLAAYLTQPKEGQHRALWHSLENVGCTDPKTAAKIMAYTDMNADALKAAAGVKATGNKAKNGPVYHVVMSWTEGQQPEQAHQLQAAREMLRVAGLDRAQALIVAHNDNGKEHLHIMVNLVDPENGKRFSLSNDRHKMQAWADEYSHKDGTAHLTPKRGKNREAWAKGEPQAKADSIPRPVMEKAERARRKDWQAYKAERDAIFARQREERGAMYAEHGAQWQDAKREAAAHKAAYKAAFRAAYAVAKAEDKAANKPLWRDTFRAQTAERASVDRRLEDCRQQAEQARREAHKAMRAVAKAERRTKSKLGALAQRIGLTATPDDARARQVAAAARMERAALELARAELAKAGLKAKQDADRARLAKRLGEVTFAKAQLAVDTMPRTDFGAMIRAQDERKAALIERHNAERLAAGMKPYEPRSRGAAAMSPEERLNAAKAGKSAAAFNPSADRRQTRGKPAPSFVQGANRQPTPAGMSKGTTPAAFDREALKRAEAAANQRASFDASELQKRRADDRPLSPFEKAEQRANSPEETAKRAADAFRRSRDRGRDDFER